MILGFKSLYGLKQTPRKWNGKPLVSWKSKKQPAVSHSSTESEYRALGSISCEILWILKVLFDLGVKDLTPSNVYLYNNYRIP